MTNNIWSVSSLLQFIKMKLDNEPYLQSLWLKGEISNFMAHRSGHWYFTIKDESSRVSCIMFSTNASKVGFMPKEGDKVVLKANVSLYPVQGQLQLYVLSIEHDGIGDLYLKFEQLKKKLFAEGLFDESRKKKIPIYPNRIAVISGKETAALQDILTTLKKRWPIANVECFYTLVQGMQAAPQLIGMLKNVDEENFDVILLTRGGGSIEDLWAFNDEKLARTIASLHTPIITGVGHETDITIVDYVSDLRAPTPTAAAQAAVRDQVEVQSELKQIKNRLKLLMNSSLTRAKLRYNPLVSAAIFTNPELLWQDAAVALTFQTQRLSASSSFLQIRKNELNRIGAKLQQISVLRLNQAKSRHSTNGQKLRNAIQVTSSKGQYKMVNSINLLQAYSPLAVLQRGYSLTYQNERIVKSIEEVSMDEPVRIRLSNGILISQPLQKEKDHE